MTKGSHLVFYDGECGLCDRTVQLLLYIDHKHLFVFAPLQGQTAQYYLKDLSPQLKSIDSVILIENYQSHDPQIYFLSKAVFRIFWLEGGVWSLIGWLYFLPSFLFNWAYRLVARYRYQLFSNDQCQVPASSDPERFLP